MRNNPRTESKLDYLVDAEFEIDTGEDDSQITVLIKHDYYSSDNEHGRTLLDSFLKTFKTEQFSLGSVILIDSGVKLAGSGLLSDVIESCSANTVYICTESLEYYGIVPSVRHTAMSSSDIFSMICWMQAEGERIIVIE